MELPTNRKELSEVFFKCIEEKNSITKREKELNANLAEIEDRMVLVMENEDLQNFKDDRFGTVFLQYKVYASIEDQPKAFKWLRNNNMRDLIKFTVHAGTLAATVKEYGEIPGVKSTYKTKLGYRRDKSNVK